MGAEAPSIPKAGGSRPIPSTASGLGGGACGLDARLAPRPAVGSCSDDRCAPVGQLRIEPASAPSGGFCWCQGERHKSLQPSRNWARKWCHGATGARHHTEASLTPRRLLLYHRVFTGGWLDAGGHGPRRAARLVMSCSPIFGSTGFLRQLAPLLVPSTGAKARARFTCNHAEIEPTYGAVVPVVPGTRESPSPFYGV